MRMRTIIWVVTFTVVVGSLTMLINAVNRTLFPSSQPPNARPVATTPIPSAAPIASPIGSRSATYAPAPESAQDQHWEALKVLTEARLQASEAKKQVGLWTTEIEPLLESEAGEVVAADQSMLKKLAFVISRKRTSAAEIEAMSQQIDAMQARVDKAAKASPPELLTARDMYEIRELQTKSSTAREQWRSSLEEAQAIVLKSRLQANPIAAPTLKEGLDQIKADEVLEDLDDKITRQESGLKSEVVSIASTDGELANSINGELREKATSTEVKTALAPFLARRKMQPKLSGTFTIRFPRTATEAPMSYSKLVSIGVLDDSISGLKKLAGTANCRSRNGQSISNLPTGKKATKSFCKTHSRCSGNTAQF